MLTLAIGDLFIPDRSIDLPPKFQKLLAPQPNNTPTNSKIDQVICLGNVTNSNSTLDKISPQFNLVKGEFDDTLIISQQLSLLNKNNTIPLYNKFVHDNLKIGYTNGHQIVPKGDPLALSAAARELDVDVLIWGGTHKVEAYTLDGKFFINPGSATGAFNFDSPDEEEEEDEQEEKEDEKKVDEEEEKPKEDVEETEESKTEDNKEEIVATDSTTDDKPVDTKQLLYEVTEINTNIPSFCLLDTHGSTCILYIYTHIDGEVKVDKVTYTKD
ncbi:LOW QUALITY PROTEIN: VPS29 Vacuolar protein sorting-associated protein 29 [Candida maltosa Xu316]